MELDILYIKRKIEEKILSINNTFPVLMLTGPRQAGKTTLLNRLSENDRKYVTLDDPNDHPMFKHI